MGSDGGRRGRAIPAPTLTRLLRAVLALILGVLLAACGASADHDGATAPALPDYPPPPDGIKMIAQRYLEPGADPVAIAVALWPYEADYAELFRPDRVTDARLHYGGTGNDRVRSVPHPVRPSSRSSR